MKKIVAFFAMILVISACNSGVEKPDNLISEDKMVDIIYDLSLLEGIRSSNYNSFKERGINPAKYVYTKYKVDSLQFAKSDHYYASDIEKYAKIYDRVSERLENTKKNVDSLSRTNPEPAKPKPDVQSSANSKKDSALARKRELLRKINLGTGNTSK